MEIKYVQMIYTNDYDTVGMKSKRPLLRAYQKAGIDELIEDNCPFVLGYVCEGMLFDVFSNREIPATGDLVEIRDDEFVNMIVGLSKEKCQAVADIIGVMFFDEEIDLGFDISNMYELADDRRIQWDAYARGLTVISPYDKETMNNYTVSKIKKYNLK